LLRRLLIGLSRPEGVRFNVYRDGVTPSFLPGWRPSSELSNPMGFRDGCQPDR